MEMNAYAFMQHKKLALCTERLPNNKNYSHTQNKCHLKTLLQIQITIQSSS